MQDLECLEPSRQENLTVPKFNLFHFQHPELPLQPAVPVRPPRRLRPPGPARPDLLRGLRGLRQERERRRARQGPAEGLHQRHRPQGHLQQEGGRSVRQGRGVRTQRYFTSTRLKQFPGSTAA